MSESIIFRKQTGNTVEIKGTNTWDRSPYFSPKRPRSKGTLLAPMYLILERFSELLDGDLNELEDIGGFKCPTKRARDLFRQTHISMTGNGEIIYGRGTFRGIKDDYVVTWHGGVDETNCVIPSIIPPLKDRNYILWGGEHMSYLFLDDLHDGKGEQIFQKLLDGEMYDGKKTALFTPKQLETEENKEHLERFRSWAVVRTFKEYGLSNDIIEYSRSEKGLKKKIHPQIIDWSGSPRRAERFVEKIKEFNRYKDDDNRGKILDGRSLVPYHWQIRNLVNDYYLSKYRHSTSNLGDIFLSKFQILMMTKDPPTTIVSVPCFIPHDQTCYGVIGEETFYKKKIVEGDELFPYEGDYFRINAGNIKRVHQSLEKRVL